MSIAERLPTKTTGGAFFAKLPHAPAQPTSETFSKVWGTEQKILYFVYKDSYTGTYMQRKGARTGGGEKLPAPCLVEAFAFNVSLRCSCVAFFSSSRHSRSSAISARHVFTSSASRDNRLASSCARRTPDGDTRRNKDCCHIILILYFRRSKIGFESGYLFDTINVELRKNKIGFESGYVT